jgi:hypothetical protein
LFTGYNADQRSQIILVGPSRPVTTTEPVKDHNQVHHLNQRIPTSNQTTW